MTAQDICNLLNEARRIDPVAMDAFMQLAVPVNMALRDHPTIQVRTKNNAGEFPMMSLLGFLNGLAWREGQYITANYDLEHHVLLGFTVHQAPKGEHETVPAA